MQTLPGLTALLLRALMVRGQQKKQNACLHQRFKGFKLVTFILISGCLISPVTELMDSALQADACCLALAQIAACWVHLPKNMIGSRCCCCLPTARSSAPKKAHAAPALVHDVPKSVNAPLLQMFSLNPCYADAMTLGRC